MKVTERNNLITFSQQLQRYLIGISVADFDLQPKQNNNN
jgi:hypothetical protein